MFNIGTTFEVIKDFPATHKSPVLFVGQTWTVQRVARSRWDVATIYHCTSSHSLSVLRLNTFWWPEWTQYIRVIDGTVNTSAVNAIQTLRLGSIEVVL